MKKIVIVETISLMFIILFIYAAVSKLLDLETFTVQIGKSPLLTSISDFIAWFIPSIEVLVALMLTIKRFLLWGLYASFTLMAIFTFYIIAILSFSEKLPCSCGGVLSNLNWKEHLVFNITFVVLAVVAIILNFKLKQIRSHHQIKI